MPIKIPDNLPATETLLAEGITVMSESTAQRQDIRPLSIGLLNLMPKKIETETQFARLIGSTPLQIDFTLIRLDSHKSKNTPESHMKAFYQSFSQIKDRYFDGLIITGAPIEHLDYTDVSYWPELCQIFHWSQKNTHHCFGICWGGMALLYYRYGIKKQVLKQKLFGCFPHENLSPHSVFLRGFSDDCLVPVSRWTNLDTAAIKAESNLKILLNNADSGVCLIEDPKHASLYCMNHFEYDSYTLDIEYKRDLSLGLKMAMPINYYDSNNGKALPINSWRAHGHLLFSNWLGAIYQSTPFDITKVNQVPFEA